MTSKEQTIKRIENQKEKMEEDNQTFGRTSVFDRLELKYLESVLKDLEVLEIIKKHTHSMEVTMPDNKIKILGWAIPKGSLNGKEIKIIKEWMENDR